MVKPAPVAWTGSYEQMAAISKAAFGTGPSDVAGVPAWVKAGAVGMAESHGNPKAINPIPVDGGCKGGKSKNARGLWQIIPNCHPKYDEASLLEPWPNAVAAAEISQRGTNWSQWSTGHGRNRSPSGGAWLQYQRGIQAAGDKPGAATQSSWGPLPIPNPVDTAGDVIEGAEKAADLASALGNLASFVTDSSNWMRVLWVAMGSGLVVVGAIMISRDTVTRIASAVATGGTSEVGKALL